MDAEVRKVQDRGRYELLVDGKVVGFADYHLNGAEVTFPHTVIDSGLRGRGLGEVLVRGALDDVRQAGRRVVPRCWFVADFLDANPDYADLRVGA